MKLRYIFTALVATLALAVGCEKETSEFLKEVQVSSSYVALPTSGGSTSINVTATDSWSFDKLPNWLTISPMSGNAGETSVTFSAGATLDGRTASLVLNCGGRTQNINVIQGLATVSVATCAEIIAGPDSKTYRVSGVVEDIYNTQYGNWYLNDGTGRITIYGTLDAKGNTKNFSSLGLENGDQVTVEGPKTTYGTTVELVDVTVISIVKNLIKVDSLTVAGVKCSEIPVEGGEITAHIMCKGNGINASIPDDAKDWLSISSVDGANNTITFKAVANEGGDRSTILSFSTSDGKKSYTAEAEVIQKGSILPVSCAEFNAAPAGTAQYRVSGIVTKITSTADNEKKYGTNLYIKDASGEEVYLYGSVDANGDIDPLVPNHGVKVGDILTLVGAKSVYEKTGASQMVKGRFESVKHVTPMKAADVAALADDDKNDPQNYISLTGVVTEAGNGNKTDLATYGNFDLVDETGAIYVYGVSTGWNGETKKFGTLGVKEGDTITIIAYKTSYKSVPQVVGMYVSHKSGAEGLPSQDGKVTLTPDMFPDAYAENAEVVSGGYKFSANQIANYGNGIQFKKNISVLTNTTEFGKIKKITLTPAASKQWYNNNITVYVGDTEVKASDENCTIYDFSALDAKTFSIKDLSNYAAYLDKIEIEYE